MQLPRLLLLHGAIGSSAQFEPLLPLLRDRFELHRFDFEGHGSSPLRSRPFRMEYFVENVMEYLERLPAAPIDVFGYSMGGYVACYLAALHPGRVERIVTLGTKFVWNAEVARRETALLDPARIQAKVPQFAQALSERHTATDWKTVLEHTAELLWSQAANNRLDANRLAAIDCPVRILVGERDATVDIEEAREVARIMPRAEAMLLADTPHPFEKVPYERLAQALGEFFGR